MEENTKQCEFCKTEVPIDAHVCSSCGASHHSGAIVDGNTMEVKTHLEIRAALASTSIYQKVFLGGLLLCIIVTMLGFANDGGGFFLFTAALTIIFGVLSFAMFKHTLKYRVALLQKEKSFWTRPNQ